MFIQAKTVFLTGSHLVVPGETVEVNNTLGERLVKMKAAVEYPRFAVATAHAPSGEADPNGTIPSDEDGGNTPGDSGNEKDDLTDDDENLIFSTDMKANELRAAMRERGLTISVGMSKAEMVEALNGTGDDLPDITPQDVVEE